LIACSATVYGAVVCGPLLESLGPKLQRIMRDSWEAAIELSKMERTVQEMTPALVLGYAVYMGREYHVDWLIPYPIVPQMQESDHGRPYVISLHLKDGGLGAIMEHVLEKVFQGVPPAFRKFTEGALDYTKSMAGSDDEPNPLVLDD